MPKQKNYGYIDYGDGRRVALDKDDSPEWTAADFKNAKRFEDLPKDLQEGLLSLKKRGRPKVARPKQVKSFKLSADVIEAIMASGKGYNVRVEAALRAAIASGKI